MKTQLETLKDCFVLWMNTNETHVKDDKTGIFLDYTDLLDLAHLVEIAVMNYPECVSEEDILDLLSSKGMEVGNEERELRQEDEL